MPCGPTVREIIAGVHSPQLPLPNHEGHGRTLLTPLARHTHRPAVFQREGAATLYAVCSMQFLSRTAASSKSIIGQATLLQEPSASALKRGIGIRRPLSTGSMPKDYVQSREGAPGSLEACSTATRLNRDGARKARWPEQPGQPHGWFVEFGLSSRWCRVHIVELRRGSADVVEFASGWPVVIQWSSSAQTLV